MMKSFNRYPGIDSYAVYLIRYHAQALCATRWCFSPDELEDVEQELLLDYLQRLPEFDSKKSSLRTFTSTVIKRKAFIMVRNATTEKRGGGFIPRLLSEIQFSGDQDDHIKQKSWEENLCEWEVDPSLEHDVNRHISLLPEFLASICERLKTETITEISNSTLIPRSTLYDAIERIRQHFLSSGLGVYAPSIRRIKNAPSIYPA